MKLNFALKFQLFGAIDDPEAMKLFVVDYIGITTNITMLTKAKLIVIGQSNAVHTEL